MHSLYKKLLLSIRELIIGSVAIAAIGLFYLNSTGKSSAAPAQQHMQDVQTGQFRAQKPTNNLIPQNPVNTATVTIEGFQFKPNNLVLKKGGKVTFINKDSAPHTATPEKEAQFVGTGQLKTKESKTVVFNTLGVHNYFCQLHPRMKGKITVVR